MTSLDLAAVKSGEKRPARYGPMIDANRLICLVFMAPHPQADKFSS